MFVVDEKFMFKRNTGMKFVTERMNEGRNKRANLKIRNKFLKKTHTLLVHAVVRQLEADRARHYRGRQKNNGCFS